VFITNGLDDIVLESQLTKGQWCPMGFISLHSGIFISNTHRNLTLTLHWHYISQPLLVAFS